MWTSGEFDIQVALDDLVRPKRTVNTFAERSGYQPKRSYAQQAKYIHYGRMTGHSWIINAECPFQFL